MQPISVRIKIRLRDTDATGVLYFTEQLRMALDVLEEHFSIRDMLEKEDFLLPIVHAESNYFSPLRVGDMVDISVQVQKIGTTSFALGYQFLEPCSEKLMGNVTIVHVAVGKESGAPISLPEKVLGWLRGLAQITRKY